MIGDLTQAQRLIAVLDHLGLGRAHVATMIPGDITPLAAADADRLAGVVLCTPVFLDPTPFSQLAGRVLMVSGNTGLLLIWCYVQLIGCRAPNGMSSTAMKRRPGPMSPPTVRPNLSIA